RLAQAVAAMLEVLIFVGQAAGNGVRSEEPGGLGIGGQHLELDALAGIGIQRGAVFRLVVVKEGVGEDAAELALVGQEVIAFYRVVVGRVAVFGDAASGVLPA